MAVDNHLQQQWHCVGFSHPMSPSENELFAGVGIINHFSGYIS